VGLLLLSTTLPSLVVSAFIVGALVPGIVVLVLGRVRELVPYSATQQKTFWSIATVAFAVGQAAAAYGQAFLFEVTGSYRVLFATSVFAIFAAFAIDMSRPMRQ
jgi:predicted MFS family arabinose efflux permease